MLNPPPDFNASSEQSGEVPLDVAEGLLRASIEKLKNGAINWHERPEAALLAVPPHSAVKITTGGGKSHVLRDAIAEYVREAKSRGLPYRVLYAVPTHALGNEAISKMPAGVGAELFQGREATSVVDGGKMCLNLPAVEAAKKMGANVEKTVCKAGTGEDEIKCLFYDRCEYQRQKKPVKAADVVFCAHQLLFQPTKELLGEFGLIIADEGFWQSGKRDTSNFVIAQLDRALSPKEFPVRDGAGRPDEDSTRDLRSIIETVQGALNALPDGFVTKSPLLKAGLLPATVGAISGQEDFGSFAKARTLEWLRKVDPGLDPGSSDAEREGAAGRLGFLGGIPGRVAMWHAFGDLLDGDAETTGRLKVWTDREGVRKLRVLGHKDIHKDLAALPIIVADATLQLDLTRYYLPRLEVALDLDIRAPHQKITQAIGTSTSKSELVPGINSRSDAEEARVANKRQGFVNWVRLKAAEGGTTLVITYKAIEGCFEGIPGVVTGHFGALEGIDCWKDVARLVVIGRQLPAGQAIEEITCAMTGQPVTVDDDSMIETEAYIRMRDGTTHPIKTKVYENPYAEIVRRAVVEAGVVQAIGRGRGVRRTDDNPLEVFLFIGGTVVEGLTIDKVIKWKGSEGVKPNRIDEMILRRLVPQFPTDAARIYPDLFPTRKAAKMAYHKAGFVMELSSEGEVGPKSLYRILIGKWDQPPRIVRYQPTGKGQVTRAAAFDPGKFPDIRATLEAALGPLAAFEVLPVGSGPEPAAPEPESSQAAPDPDPDPVRYPKLSPELICKQNQWFGRNRVPYLSPPGGVGFIWLVEPGELPNNSSGLY
jgi:hypothetical protein